MEFGILMHEASDDVGVAVMDLQGGAEIGAATLEGKTVGTVTIVGDIPLGHKVAMREIQKDSHIIEYGQPIGHATEPILRGAHVHVHNLKTSRWSS